MHSEHNRKAAGPGKSRAGLAMLVGFGIFALWAMMSTIGAPAERLTGATNRGALVSGSVLVVFAACFTSLAMNLFDRLTTVVLGAGACLMLGSGLSFYFPPDAALYLQGKSDTLLLLASMGVVTGVLVESGYLDRVAWATVKMSRGDRRRVFQLLCLLTYVLSLSVNNLTTIMVIIPMSLVVAQRMDMDPVPLVLGEIVASNLGGASTMVGDFPNMLLATDLGLPFQDFLFFLAPVCLLQLGILILYLQSSYPAGSSEERANSGAASAQPMDSEMAFRGKVILGGVLVGFILGGEFGVSPAHVAALGVLWVIVWARLPFAKLVDRVGMDDVAFFACLFIMVGAVSASGAFDGLGPRLTAIWHQSPVAGAIALACSAAVLTAFFNAGPTTALLIHILLAGAWPEEFIQQGAGLDRAVWWALSLGVCAGSSATLTGATAGPVAASILEKNGKELSFVRFAASGVPLMMIFLAVSSVYLAVLVSFG